MVVSKTVKIAIVMVLLGLAASINPTIAKAQNRGSLQVSARVVDPKSSLDGLQAARQAVLDYSAARAVRENVSTVAQVSVARKPETRELVVTITYVKS